MSVGNKVATAESGSHLIRLGSGLEGLIKPTVWT